MADLYADVHIVPTPEWADPLCTPGSQFPLAPPVWWWEGSEDEPSADLSVRPFSLRGVVAGTRMDAPDPWTYDYDPVRQIGVYRNSVGEIVKLNKHTKPGVTPAETTGIKSDGDPKNPPPEEMGNKDYQSD